MLGIKVDQIFGLWSVTVHLALMVPKLQLVFLIVPKLRLVFFRAKNTSTQ